MSNNIPSYLPSIGKSVRFVGYKVGDIYATFLQESGLTLQQWVLLSGLWRQDGMTVSEMSVYTHTGKAAISRLVSRMEIAELVKRESEASDSRVVRIWLTEKAKGLSHLSNLYEKVNAVLFEGFDEKEQKYMFEALDRMLKNADAFTK